VGETKIAFGRWARVLVASAGGDAAAVVATGEADGATNGESCLRVFVASAGGDARRRSWRQERQMDRRRERAVCGVASGTRPVHPSAVGRSLAAQDGAMALITFLFLQHHENRPKVKNQNPLLGRMRLSTLFARGLIFCRRRIWSKSPPARQAARPAPAPSQLRRAFAP